ncbi:hypothetical protein FHX82_004930 [Amycolatopsis bartoniae]|uniref:Transcriptional regulator SbtR-like C-terminal domain-containing protein n=1 Tax=Amycolatopsis bartoniae TaxID=941986 RepID=A0A8H9IPA2_9PSEU|nr:hypothetical protein [Amycolatopsis bartoniae]MBB2937854.1 hypothetical protein [Amycolatopsis bartoniae]TVT01333.1 hypothetical protein FNH07_29695 [Amycolatopsis bartoniae]GHF41227.1 hypothetical protein GCM10017566_13320 [Amycolatopsis bartoniae]
MITRFAQWQLSDRGLHEVLFGGGEAFADQRRAHARGLDRLVEHARRAGAIRQDVTAEDVHVGLLAIASLRTRSRPVMRRLVNLVLAGLTPAEPGARSPARAPAPARATGRAAG